MDVSAFQNKQYIDLLEEILWTGFSGTLWFRLSSFMVEFPIVSTVREDTGCPGGYNNKDRIKMKLSKKYFYIRG